MPIVIRPNSLPKRSFRAQRTRKALEHAATFLSVSLLSFFSLLLVSFCVTAVLLALPVALSVVLYRYVTTRFAPTKRS